MSIPSALKVTPSFQMKRFAIVLAYTPALLTLQRKFGTLLVALHKFMEESDISMPL